MSRLFRHHGLRRATLAAMLVLPLASCGSDTPTASSGSLAGTYRATAFRVTPTGQPAIDVLPQGGSLTLTIAADRSTTGSLSLPASAAGGTALTASMAGTAVQTGGTIRLQQTADTFVRDLTWSVSASALSVTEQQAGGARFTITLTRQ